MNIDEEIERQESLSWDRSSDYAEYKSILAFFQAQSVLENARGESLLDLACGDATITAMLCHRFKRVVGVDASGLHLAKAKEKCPEAEFRESLIENLEISREKFDTITLLNILEHAIDPVVLLQKASTFLKDEGVMIIHVPNALAVNRVIARIMGTLVDEYELSPYDINVAGHRRSYDRNLLVEDVGGGAYRLLQQVASSTKCSQLRRWTGSWKTVFGKKEDLVGGERG